MPPRRTVSIALVVLTFALACGRRDSASPSSAPAAKAAPVAPQVNAPAAAPASIPAGTAWNGFRPENGPIVAGKAVSSASLSPSEQKYGIAPARGPGVVYQDQVVLIEHGDKAIKAAEDNGLGWTLDGTDPRIAALKVGDIVFATTSCVGRILKLTRSGDGVQVILGPAPITDIIKQGNFAYSAPLDLNSLTAVSEPNFPGAFGSTYFAQMKQTGGSATPGRGGSAGSGSDLVVDRVQYFVVSPAGVWRPMRTTSRRAERTIAFADEPAAGPRIVRTSYSPQLPNNTFNNVLDATPCLMDCGGLGVNLTAHKAGLQIDIKAVLRLGNPKFTFNFSVGGSRGTQAAIMLSGTAGFLLTVEGTTDPQFTSNLNEIGAIPIDVTLPVQFGPLALVLHYHQDLSLSSAFSAKTSILRARDDLTIDGNLGFIYEDGHFDPLHMHATPKVDPSHEISGISMGINSIVVGINQRLLMGLGADGVAVGPYVSLTTTATALKQATEAGQMMLPQQAIGGCTQATLQMQINGGIGLALPDIVVKAVNFFLNLVHAAPIPANITLAKITDPLQVMNEPFQLPPGCAGR